MHFGVILSGSSSDARNWKLPLRRFRTLDNCNSTDDDGAILQYVADVILQDRHLLFSVFLLVVKCNTQYANKSIKRHEEHIYQLYFTKIATNYTMLTINE